MNWLIEFQISIVWKCKLLVLFIKWTYLLKNCGVAFFDKEVKLYGWEKYTSLVSLSHGDVQYIYLYLHIYLYVKLTISFLAANPNIVWKMKWITCLHLVFEFRTRSHVCMENEVDHMFASSVWIQNKIGSHIVLLENKLLSKLQFVDNNTNLMKAPQCMIPIHINLFHETRIMKDQTQYCCFVGA
jgi:hypothetical protein